MSYDYRKLREDEIIVFLDMRKKYVDYDFIDMLIHKTLKCVGTSKDEFVNREVRKEKKKEVIAIQQEGDEINKFCDGDSCEMSIFNEKC